MQQFKRYEYYDMDTSSWQDLGYIVFSKERKKPYNLHSIEQVHRMGSPAVGYITMGSFRRRKWKNHVILFFAVEVHFLTLKTQWDGSRAVYLTWKHSESDLIHLEKKNVHNHYYRRRNDIINQVAYDVKIIGYSSSVIPYNLALDHFVKKEFLHFFCTLTVYLLKQVYFK